MKTKQLNYAFLLTVFMSMVGLNASAHDFEVDGIYYLNNSDGTLSVTYKGNSSWQGYCEYSGNVVIPGSIYYNGRWRSVTIISQYAFHWCSELLSVTIPNSVWYIENNAFDGCSGLTSINIPSGVKWIGQDAFEGCSSLTSITIPNNVTSVIYPFKGCSSLTSIEVESGNPQLDSRNNCNAIIESASNRLIAGCKTTVIPNSVTSIGSSAFSGCSGLTSITIPNSVTSIGDLAFYNCSNLTSITIPDGMTSIGSSAFYNCSGLTSITIPDGMTSIGRSAFSGTGWYDSQSDGILYLDNWLLGYKGEAPTGAITIADDTKGIAGGAFSGCSGLTSITIPESVTSIGNSAFDGCSGLTSITIPNSVTYIGESAFEYCSNLTSITIPNSVTTIGSYSFWCCTGLTSITIPSSVTSINNGTFKDCSGLTYISIPSGVKRIGLDAFKGCSSLTSITIPNGVTSIGQDAFADCNSLTSVTVDIETPLSITSSTFSNRANATLYVPYGCKDAYKAANYWKQFKEIVEMAPPSPAIEFADVNVKAICVANWDSNGDGELSEAEAAAVTDLGQVFKLNTQIESLDELHYFTGLTSIGDLAFYNCSNLKSITIPNSVKTIGRYAFMRCSGLTSITIPNSVRSIFEYAFSGSSGLTSVTIPNSVTSIGDYAFNDCSGLTSVTIPNSVTYIGEFAFYGTGMTNVTIPVTDLAVFCNNHLCYEIGKPIKLIDNEGNEIKEYVIPDGVTNIGNNAFYACKSLTCVTLPESVTTIGNNAFCACEGLTNVSIPNSVTNMGRAVFRWCHGLTNVTIGNSLARIQEAAFNDCTSLTNVKIGKSVTKIDDSVFLYCDNLTEVYCYADIVPSTTTYTFSWSNIKNATLHVPFGCKAIYEVADYWKDFKEIVEMPAETNSHLTINGQTICKGGKINLPVSMENEEDITAFQFDVVAPEGTSLTDVQLGDRKCDSHTVDFNKQADGSYMVMGVSLLSEPFSGNEGELVRLMLSSDKNIEQGDHNIDIKNIVLTSLSKGKLYPADISGVLTVLGILQGDADGDGIPDVADIVAMVNYILEKPSPDFVFLAADMNADGEVDIFDVMLAINHVLNRENSARSMARAAGAGDALEPMYMTAANDGIRLDIDNAGRFTAFQFDVEVPEGTELTGAVLTGSEYTHLIRTAKTGENSYRVMAVSLNNTSLMATAQGLLRLSLSDNSRSAVIDNIKFVTPQGESVYFSISQNGDATGIREIVTGQDEIVYDMSGRRVNTTRESLPKGIYIINNKKVVIK